MSHSPSWAPELTVTPDLARALIDDQFPALAPCAVEPLGFGWDNTAFLVNGDLAFRFPRRQLGADCLAHEIRVLPHLARRLPLPIPDPIHVGRASDQFPWPFAGYRHLAGRTACSVGLGDSQRSAAAIPLARFLRTLHSLPIDEVRQYGAPLDTLGRLDPVRRVPQAQQRLEEIKQLGLIVETDPWLAVIEETAIARPAEASVLVHGDLYLRHLLVGDDNRPCGVIDWGDVHFGDPALDLSIAHSFLPRSAHAAFRDSYGTIDEPTWRLARFRALQYGTYLAPYGYAIGDHDLVREALWILHNIETTTASNDTNDGISDESCPTASVLHPSEAGPHYPDEGTKEGQMNLTESQAYAMLEIGGRAEAHGFIPIRDLNDLQSYGLIYWEKPDEVVFTQRGEEVFAELAAVAEKDLAQTDRQPPETRNR